MSLSRWFIPTNVHSDAVYLGSSPDPRVRADPSSCVQKKTLKVFPNWSSLWTIKPLSGAIAARVKEFAAAAPVNTWCAAASERCAGGAASETAWRERWYVSGREPCLELRAFGHGLIEGCFNAVRGWQVGIIRSYLFVQKTPWLTFNDCSMRAGFKRWGKFEFHSHVETFARLCLQEDVGFGSRAGSALSLSPDSLLTGLHLTNFWRLNHCSKMGKISIVFNKISLRNQVLQCILFFLNGELVCFHGASFNPLPH